MSTMDSRQQSPPSNWQFFVLVSSSHIPSLIQVEGDSQLIKFAKKLLKSVSSEVVVLFDQFSVVEAVKPVLPSVVVLSSIRDPDSVDLYINIPIIPPKMI